MKASTYYDVIKNALFAYDHRSEFAYFYGAKGQKLTNKVMDALIAAEPNYFKRYTPEQLAEIKAFSKNKIGLDCSGFISYITGVPGYSTALYQNTTAKTVPTDGTEGNLLYTTFAGRGRHVGVDIGYGYFLHMRAEGKTIEFGKISDYKWENSGQIAGINYKGAKR